MKSMGKEAMTAFEKTNWSRPEFTRGYQENADVFIVERRRMLSILQSYYAHFLKNGGQRTILDLGCGDGIVAETVAEIDRHVSVTLVDGSRDMLGKAKERLKGLKRATYVHASFQEIIRKGMPRGPYDFIASSLAIHHLSLQEKTELFRKIFERLSRGGHFVNIDVVLAPSKPLEQWYLSLWKDWIDERKWDLGIAGDQFNDITRRYKDADENKPDTLGRQMEALRAAGFVDVDCYYQYGIFTIFGGRKPA